MSSSLVQAVGWALVHFIWQGALVAAVLLIALSVAPVRAARVRYGLACAALLAMVALPLITAARGYAAAEISSAVPAPVRATSYPATQPAVEPGEAPAAAPDAMPAVVRVAIRTLADHAQQIVLAWALGVLLFSARVLTGWVLVVQLARSAQPVAAGWQASVERLCAEFGIRKHVRLLASARIQVPSTVGWLRPVVLVPLSVLSGMPPRQLELILAHELAHIRRHDYLVNLLQTAVETLLFYHPAVWWVGTIIREERENCCDDLAVAGGATPVSYARALTALETLRAMRSPALSALGGSLPARVRRLVVPVAHCGSRWSAGASVATLLAGFALTLPVAAACLPAVRAPQEPRVVASSRDSRHDTSRSDGAADVEPAQDSDDQEAPRKQGKVVGRDSLTVDELIQLRTAGIDAAQVRLYRQLGLEPTVDNLVALGHAGVTPEYVKAMRRRFGDSLQAEELANLKNVGVTPEYIAGLAALGFKDLSVERVTNARAVGVTDAYLRDLRRAGIEAQDLEAVTNLRAVGVNGAYVAELEAQGLGPLGVEEVQSLRAVGVDGAYVRRMKAAGFPKLSAEQLQELKANGITPEYLDSLRGH